jgi:capsule assembly protein Wzi
MQRIAASLTLLICLALPGPAQVSTNVPLDHWSYPAIDKLADYGLIDSAMLSMRPISRIEMARHIAQARHSLARSDSQPALLASMMERLEAEFRGELVQIGILDGIYAGSSLKPVEDPYLKYLYADRQSELEHVRGDRFGRHSNYRAGFASRANISETVAFYLHTEYQDGSFESDADVELLEAYGKIMMGPLEVQAGKDSLWWGPGRGGSILMSNNAQPLPMIKITNPQPIQLPWIFRRLGPFRTQWFLAELEEDRDIPGAKLSAIRLNFKPHARWEIGFSRTIMFGGTGVPKVNLYDYAKMFLARTEQVENNQLAGLDTSILLPLAEIPYGKHLPLRSIKFYVDAAGEDEAGGMPSNWGVLYGLGLNDIFKTGRTDFRIEYADNHVTGKPNIFYAHSLYTSGYTYKGRILGHHMGTDSRDLFLQLSHYLTENLLVDLMYDHQTHDLSANTQPEINILQCDLTFFPSQPWQVGAGYRYEDGRGEGYDDNHIVQMQLIREF